MNRVTGILVLLVAAAIISACGATGEDALAAMSGSEKQFLEQKVSKIHKDMTSADVQQILGEPYRGHGTLRPNWLGPEGGDRSQIAVYFMNGKAFKVRWMHLGKFVWDRNL